MDHVQVVQEPEWEQLQVERDMSLSRRRSSSCRPSLLDTIKELLDALAGCINVCVLQTIAVAVGKN